MFHITDLQKKPEGIAFEERLALKEGVLARNASILDLDAVVAKGDIKYEDGIFILSYDLSYRITLASTRSMQPVEIRESYPVTELFVTAEDLATVEEEETREHFLVVEGGVIDLSESVADNILLNIPLKVLSPEEESEAVFPKGKGWQVMTEEHYAKEQAEKKSERSPFADLAGFLGKTD